MDSDLSRQLEEGFLENGLQTLDFGRPNTALYDGYVRYLEAPEDFRAYALMGFALEAKGEWRSARPFLEHAWMRGGADNRVKLSSSFAAVLLKLGETASAVEVVRVAVAMSPSDLFARYLLADALFQLGNADEGRSHLEQAELQIASMLEAGANGVVRILERLRRVCDSDHLRRSVATARIRAANEILTAELWPSAFEQHAAAAAHLAQARGLGIVDQQFRDQLAEMDDMLNRWALAPDRYVAPPSGRVHVDPEMAQRIEKSRTDTEERSLGMLRLLVSEAPPDDELAALLKTVLGGPLANGDQASPSLIPNEEDDSRGRRAVAGESKFRGSWKNLAMQIVVYLVFSEVVGGILGKVYLVTPLLTLYALWLPDYIVAMRIERGDNFLDKLFMKAGERAGVSHDKDYGGMVLTIVLLFVMPAVMAYYAYRKFQDMRLLQSAAEA